MDSGWVFRICSWFANLAKFVLPAVYVSTVLFVNIAHGVTAGTPRRAYFAGTIAYNDGGFDAAAGKGQGVCTIGGCYKLLGCQVVVSNLSTVTESIVAHSLTLNWTYTNIRSGIDNDDNDPFIKSDLSAESWSSYTTTISWASGGVANYPNTMYKYDHSSNSAELAPTGTNQGWVGTTPFDLAPNETALILIGGSQFTGGGILTYGLDATNKVKAYKNLGVCFGYIDIQDKDQTQPGFVVASGTLESKAGSYKNKTPVNYGSATVGNIPNATPATKHYDGYPLFRSYPTTIYSNSAVGGICTSPGQQDAYNAGVNACWTSGSAATASFADRAWTDWWMGAGAWRPWFWSSLLPGDTAAGVPVLTADYQSGPAGSVDPNQHSSGDGIDNGLITTVTTNVCSLTSTYSGGQTDQSKNANWPEIVFNVPITINSGKPI